MRINSKIHFNVLYYIFMAESNMHRFYQNGSDVCKTRRSHKKSRNGCEKCKTRRIKCDELKPKCSRCVKLGLTCRYSTRSPEAPDSFIQLEPPLNLQLQSNDESSGSSFCSSPFAKSPSPSLPGKAESQINLPRHSPETDLFLQSHHVQVFTTADFALLNHYLEHTSQDMTVDDGDQYALQIGIPNLALQSKPLMRSVLAFSAICKCHDIIKRSPVSPTERRNIMDLLSTADRYHMESLREIQPTLSKVQHYDHILANAAMMGMYGSGSHCIRIWLSETATSDDVSLGRFTPKSCQWISLFRAVRVAYGGLTKKSREMDSVQDTPIPPPDTAPSVSSPQPSEPQNHPLYPILAATVVSAMTKLNEKTGEIIVFQTNETSTYYDPDLQACLTALELLGNIITETFPTKGVKSSKPSSFKRGFEDNINPVDHIQKISPWMRRYTASITSTVPSKLPRRFIMAFIHKAPNRYLEIIEEMMGFTISEEPSHSLLGSTEPGVAHQLAMEIFAHWLVLVLMLDNVWWIGGIGTWELGQIVAARKDARRYMGNGDENWWPGSMLEISRQLDVYREKT